jgi:hypothetical protein
MFRKKESWMGRIRSTTQQVCATSQHSIDPATDAVLLNWGRWAGGRSGGSGASGVWRFASRGSRAAAYGNACVVVPVDTVQARHVESVVCNPGFSPKLRSLLQAHYVAQVHPMRTCRELGLHQAAYDEWVWRATVFFANRWAARHID